MSNENFYTNLPIYDKSVNEILLKTTAFQRIPMDWYIINTDIKDSTIAVKNGMSELINLVATGSIIAALNISRLSKIDIPFFFGGDGATLLVPGTLVATIMEALVKHQSNVKKTYDLDLRVGSMLVAEMYENGNELKIVKIKVNALHDIPIILGNGLQYAEKVIKSKVSRLEIQANSTSQLNLEGMECRWNRIAPPSNAEEVVCLIMNAVEEKQQAIVFKKILDQIELIYGSHEKRNPISLDKLNLNAGIKKIKAELSLRNPNFNLLEWFKNWIYVVAGKFWYLPSKEGQKYLNELVQLADTFVMDGRINMVISGTIAQRTELVQSLEEMEAKNEIIYGIFVSKQSIISCYVKDRNAQHIHFIDGGSGGYTEAAVLLKEKMRNR